MRSQEKPQTSFACLRTSVTELENAREQAEAAQFALQGSRASLKRTRDGPRLELIAQAQARVDLQSERVKQLDKVE